MIRDDDGNILISVVLISMLVGALVALALNTGRQADWASSSDRNSEVALAVAEAGLHQVVATINEQASSSSAGNTCHVFGLGVGQTTPTSCFVDATPQGAYDVRVTRNASGFELDAQAKTGAEVLGRARHVRVTLMPPPLFPDGGRYAIFSEDVVDLKNNDDVGGDVWANAAMLLDKVIVDGSVTSGLNAITFKNGTRVTGNVWSGGYDQAAGKAINLGGVTVGGWVKASVNAPECVFSPPDSLANTPSNYKVDLGGGSVAGNVTTRGTVVGGGSYGSKNEGVCTAAAGRKDIPKFTFNENNYDPSTLRKYASAAQFNAIDKSSMQGTYVIDEPNPSQTTKVDLGGARIIGHTTIVTNAPVDTNGVSELGSNQKNFVVVSRYRSPMGDCDDNGGDCAIYAKNNFDVSADDTCATSALLYAEFGQVGLKNNANMCGSVISKGSTTLKNNLFLDFDDRLRRVVGFGPQTFEIGKWEELPVR